MVEADIADMVRRIQTVGGQETVSALRQALKVKSYDLDRGFLKTVIFPEKVKHGSGYPDFSPQPSAVFPMHTQCEFMLTANRCHLLVDPEVADPYYPTLIYSMPSQAGGATIKVLSMDREPRSNTTVPVSTEESSVSPYVMFRGVRLIGCSVSVEVIGGTTFGQIFLGCSQSRHDPRNNGLAVANIRNVNDMPYSGLKPAAQLVFTEPLAGTIAAQTQAREGVAPIPAVLACMHLRRTCASMCSVVNNVDLGVNRERLQQSGMFSNGDFANGCRVWLPLGKELPYNNIEIIGMERRIIRGSITAESAALPAQGNAPGDLVRAPSVRIRIVRWFEGVPEPEFLSYIPLTQVTSNFATREYLEKLHRNLPGIFKITPRDLDAQYAKYKPLLGFDRVID